MILVVPVRQASTAAAASAPTRSEASDGPPVEVTTTAPSRSVADHPGTAAPSKGAVRPDVEQSSQVGAHPGGPSIRIGGHQIPGCAHPGQDEQAWHLGRHRGRDVGVESVADDQRRRRTGPLGRRVEQWVAPVCRRPGDAARSRRPAPRPWTRFRGAARDPSEGSCPRSSRPSPRRRGSRRRPRPDSAIRCPASDPGRRRPGSSFAARTGTRPTSAMASHSACAPTTRTREPRGWVTASMAAAACGELTTSAAVSANPISDKDSATSTGDREALFVTITVRAPRAAAALRLAAASGIGCPARTERAVEVDEQRVVTIGERSPFLPGPSGPTPRRHRSESGPASRMTSRSPPEVPGDSSASASADPASAAATSSDSASPGPASSGPASSGPASSGSA